MLYSITDATLSHQFDTLTSWMLKIAFKTDGSKMYTLVDDGKVREYDLSSNWSIKTASHLQSLDVTPEESKPRGFHFKPDGAKMYVVGEDGMDVTEYDLSVAWDISSAVPLQTFSVATDDNKPYAITFKPDGTRMYIIGVAHETIYEYNIGVAWDISSASLIVKFSDFNGLTGLTFKPDGTRMYLSNVMIEPDVVEYSLSRTWDVESAVYVQTYPHLTSSGAADIKFNNDGSILYIAEYITEINEYGLTTSKSRVRKSS